MGKVRHSGVNSILEASALSFFKDFNFGNVSNLGNASHNIIDLISNCNVITELRNNVLHPQVKVRHFTPGKLPQ